MLDFFSSHFSLRRLWRLYCGAHAQCKGFTVPCAGPPYSTRPILHCPLSTVQCLCTTPSYLALPLLPCTALTPSTVSCIALSPSILPYLAPFTAFALPPFYSICLALLPYLSVLPSLCVLLNSLTLHSLAQRTTQPLHFPQIHHPAIALGDNFTDIEFPSSSPNTSSRWIHISACSTDTVYKWHTAVALSENWALKD